MQEFNVGDTVYVKGHEYFDINDLAIDEAKIDYISEKTTWTKYGATTETKYDISIKNKQSNRSTDKVYKTKKDIKRAYIQIIKEQIKSKQEEIDYYNKVVKKLEHEIGE